MQATHGRDDECTVLERIIATAAEGAGGVILIEGAPGIGKSHLLAAAQARAGALGLRVATGAADELDRATPWGAFERALVSPGSGLLDRADLAQLRGMADQRMAVIEHIRTVLEQSSQAQPLLVAVDNLQWADPATLLALSSLPRQLFSYPIAWLLARRPTPSDNQLEALLRRLDECGAERMHLSPLDPAASLAVAWDAAREAAPEDLGNLEDRIRDAAGNPYYIIELMRADLLNTSSGLQRPSTVRSSVTRHLRSLSEESRHLVSIASVLGRDFSVAELAATTGRPASRLLWAVEEAIAAEIFEEHTDRLAFRHDLLRQRVYSALPASLRTALHRDAAEALRDTGAPVVRVAGHVAVSARRGDSQAVSAVNAAVVELLSTSPNAAANLALKALALVEEDDRRRPDMVLTAIRALGLVGRRAEAVGVSKDFLAGGRPPAHIEAALELELREAWIFEHLRPYPTPFPAHLTEGPGIDPVIVATAVACDQDIWQTSGEESGRLFTEAMRLADEGGRAFEFTTLTYLQLLNCFVHGRMAEAQSHAEGALEAARRLEQPRTTGAHETILAASLGANGRYRDSLDMLQHAILAAEASGRSYFTVQGQWLRAMHLLAAGRLDDARAEAHTAVATAEEYTYPGHRAHGLAVLVETAVRQGDLKAERAAMGRFGPLEVGWPRPDRLWASAVSATAHQDLMALANAIRPLREQLEHGSFVLTISQHHRSPELVHMARRLEDHDCARAFADAAEVLAGLNPEVHSLSAAAVHSRAILEGDVDLLERAVDEAALGEARLLQASAHRDLGQLLGQRGSRDDAIHHLERSFDLYQAMGAQRELTRVRADMRLLGIRKRSAPARPTQGWESLTRAERAVVAIVAQGATNRQAATELCLSADTINTHLRHAFAKLGIRSRVELARLTHERGIPSGEG